MNGKPQSGLLSQNYEAWQYTHAKQPLPCQSQQQRRRVLLPLHAGTLKTPALHPNKLTESPCAHFIPAQGATYLCRGVELGPARAGQRILHAALRAASQQAAMAGLRPAPLRQRKPRQEEVVVVFGGDLRRLRREPSLRKNGFWADGSISFSSMQLLLE